MLHRITDDLEAPLGDLGPRDLPVAIAVDVEGVIEIAHRDVPSPVDDRAVDLERQVRIARLVRVRPLRDEERDHDEQGRKAAHPPPAHRVSSAAALAIAGSSSFVVASHWRTGSASFLAFAATAAST